MSAHSTTNNETNSKAFITTFQTTQQPTVHSPNWMSVDYTIITAIMQSINSAISFTINTNKSAYFRTIGILPFELSY